MINTNPLIGFFRTIFLYLAREVHFVKSSVGKEFTMDDGVTFKVFRHVVIGSPEKNRANPEAVFKVRFLLKNMTLEENERFSKIPMLVFMGFRGFRSKYWMVNEETGLCLGVYEWDTMRDAVNYSKSIALKFITRRSVQGSVKYEIIEKKDF